MFVKAELWTVGRTGEGVFAFLRFPGSTKCISLPIDSDEAQSILLSVAGIEGEPPGWPEMLNSFCRAVGMRPDSVELRRGLPPEKYRAVVYFTEIVPESDRCFSLELKASQALSLAVRSGAGIFVDEAVQREDSVTVSLSETTPSYTTRLNNLKAELDAKVAAEEYEEAAGLRDRIKLIEARMRSAGK